MIRKMAELQADQVEDDVMNSLPTLSATELEEICTLIGATMTEEDKGKKRVLLKLVMRVLCDPTATDDKMTEFLQIYKYLKLEDTEVGTEDGGDKQGIKQEGSEGAAAASVVQNTVESKPGKGGKSAGLGSGKAEGTMTVTRTIRKDFKLSGMIGGEGESALTYSGLKFEIDKARKLGHSETEICSTVISKVADKELRCYFETEADMELDEVLCMLKSVCREQKSSAVFTQFTNDKQESNEKAITFITRVLRLRKRVLKLGKEEGKTYDEEMLAERSFEVIFGGLRSDNIRSALRDKCKNDHKLPDKKVLAHAADVIEAEKERKRKLFGKAVESESDDVEVSEMMSEFSREGGATRLVRFDEQQIKKDKKNKINPFTEIDELRCQMKENDDRVTAQLNEIKQLVLKKNEGDKPETKTTGKRKCPKCVSENRFWCRHCWECGSDDHKRPECPENQ